MLRTVKETLLRAGAFAYRDRRARKREFRRLWITRISAAARERGISYSRLMQGLKAADVRINRKAMSDLAITDPGAFGELVELAKSKIA